MGDYEGPVPVPTLNDQLAASVKGARDFLQALAAIVEAGGTVADLVRDGDDGDDLEVLADHGVDLEALETLEDLTVFELINDGVLEVYGNARITSADSVDVRSIVLVLGTGGPHIEVELWWNGDSEARGFWGSSEDRRRFTIGRDLGDVLADIMFGGWDR